jgi:hypothetical protein
VEEGKAAPEEELTLAQEFMGLEEEHAALMKRMRRLKERLGMSATRRRHKDPAAVQTEKKTVPEMVIEAVRAFLAITEKEEKFQVKDPGRTTVAWMPDMYLTFRMEKKITVRIAAFERVPEEGGKTEPLDYDEISWLKAELKEDLETILRTLPDQIEIELAEGEE